MKKTRWGLFVCLLFCFLSVSLLLGDEEYTVGVDDVIDVLVWKQPDFSHTFRVSPSGNIFYPFLGTIKVAGLTLKEVETTIKESLENEYIKDAKVGVVIRESNSRTISVFGEVLNPGVYNISKGTPVLEVLFKAGGLTEKAGALLRITRKKAINEGATEETPLVENISVDIVKLMVKGDLEQNMTILPGDILYISQKEEKYFYVLGEVKNPGNYTVEEATVLKAIKIAGGFNAAADKSEIEIIREQNGETAKLKVNFDAIEKEGDLGQNIAIMDGDIINVTKREEKVIYVMGQVKNPGPYKFDSDITVLEAINSAGGFGQFAAKNRVEVIREEGGKTRKIKVSVAEIERKGKIGQDILLKPGDIVTVPESWF